MFELKTFSIYSASAIYVVACHLSLLYGAVVFSIAEKIAVKPNKLVVKPKRKFSDVLMWWKFSSLVYFTDSMVMRVDYNWTLFWIVCVRVCTVKTYKCFSFKLKWFFCAYWVSWEFSTIRVAFVFLLCVVFFREAVIWYYTQQNNFMNST